MSDTESSTIIKCDCCGARIAGDPMGVANRWRGWFSLTRYATLPNPAGQDKNEYRRACSKECLLSVIEKWS